MLMVCGTMQARGVLVWCLGVNTDETFQAAQASAVDAVRAMHIWRAHLACLHCRRRRRCCSVWGFAAALVGGGRGGSCAVMQMQVSMFPPVQLILIQVCNSRDDMPVDADTVASSL